MTKQPKQKYVMVPIEEYKEIDHLKQLNDSEIGKLIEQIDFRTKEEENVIKKMKMFYRIMMQYLPTHHEMIEQLYLDVLNNVEENVIKQKYKLIDD